MNRLSVKNFIRRLREECNYHIQGVSGGIVNIKGGKGKVLPLQA
jgi:hypothetical protein